MPGGTEARPSQAKRSQAKPKPVEGEATQDEQNLAATPTPRAITLRRGRWRDPAEPSTPEHHPQGTAQTAPPTAAEPRPAPPPPSPEPPKSTAETHPPPAAKQSQHPPQPTAKPHPKAPHQQRK